MQMLMTTMHEDNSQACKVRMADSISEWNFDNSDQSASAEQVGMNSPEQRSKSVIQAK